MKLSIVVFCGWWMVELKVRACCCSGKRVREEEYGEIKVNIEEFDSQSEEGQGLEGGGLGVSEIEEMSKMP